jgi:hypothetical protein
MPSSVAMYGGDPIAMLLSASRSPVLGGIRRAAALRRQLVLKITAARSGLPLPSSMPNTKRASPEPVPVQPAHSRSTRFEIASRRNGARLSFAHTPRPVIGDPGQPLAVTGIEKRRSERWARRRKPLTASGISHW